MKYRTNKEQNKKQHLYRLYSISNLIFRTIPNHILLATRLLSSKAVERTIRVVENPNGLHLSRKLVIYSWTRMLKPVESELDAIHVSTGGNIPVQPSDVYNAYQLPHAAAIKQHFNIPIIAVGKIYTRSLVNRILEDQLADGIAIGRPLLDDPDFAEHLLIPEEHPSTL